MHFLARPSCGVKFLLFLSVSQNLWTFSISAVEKQKTQRRTTKATTTTTTTTTPAEEETIELESDVGVGHNGSTNVQGKKILIYTYSAHHGFGQAQLGETQLWWFSFRLKSIFVIAPAAVKHDEHFKSEPKIIILLC